MSTQVFIKEATDERVNDKGQSCWTVTTLYTVGNASNLAQLIIDHYPESGQDVEIFASEIFDFLYELKENPSDVDEYGDRDNSIADLEEFIKQENLTPETNRVFQIRISF